MANPNARAYPYCAYRNCRRPATFLIIAGKAGSGDNYYAAGGCDMHYDLITHRAHRLTGKQVTITRLTPPEPDQQALL